MKEIDFYLGEIGDYSEEDYLRASEVAKIHRGLIGTNGILGMSPGFHDSKPHLLVFIRPGTLNPNTLLPDEVDGLPIYFQVSNPQALGK